MFEDYLEDAYILSKLATQQASDREKRRYYRAAVFYASSAIEAFINYIGETLQTGGALSDYERAFLLDRKFGLRTGTFRILEQAEFHRLEDKLKFLLARFRPCFDPDKQPAWSHFNELKDLRDRIVHPRVDDDDISPAKYKSLIRNGLGGVVSIMDELCQGVFDRRLRKKLRDLAT